MCVCVCVWGGGVQLGLARALPPTHALRQLLIVHTMTAVITSLGPVTYVPPGGRSLTVHFFLAGQ